jgi:hypothetical protein
MPDTQTYSSFLFGHAFQKSNGMRIVISPEALRRATELFDRLSADEKAFLHDMLILLCRCIDSRPDVGYAPMTVLGNNNLPYARMILFFQNRTAEQIEATYAHVRVKVDLSDCELAKRIVQHQRKGLKLLSWFSIGSYRAELMMTETPVERRERMRRSMTECQRFLCDAGLIPIA